MKAAEKNRLTVKGRPLDGKLTSLNADDEGWLAYVIALHLKSRAYMAAGAMIGDSPRLLRLVADALENKPPRFNPTPTCLNILRAYEKALISHARTASGIDIDALFEGPTITEVENHFSHNGIPANWTIRDPLNRLKLQWREDKRGPRGSRKNPATSQISAARRKFRN